MLDRIQANYLTMYRTVSGHMGKNPTVRTAIVALEDLTLRLDAKIAEIDAVLADEEKSEGYTKNKKTARENSIRYAEPIAAAIKAEANSVSDAVLLKKVDYSKSDLEGLREEKFMPAVEAIAKEAGELATAIGKRGILPVHIANLVKWNAAFRKLMATPGTTQTEITVDGSLLEKKIGEVLKMLDEEMDPTAKAASLSFPDFTVGYESARVIIDRDATQGGGDGAVDPTSPTI